MKLLQTFPSSLLLQKWRWHSPAHLRCSCCLQLQTGTGLAALDVEWKDDFFFFDLQKDKFDSVQKNLWASLRRNQRAAYIALPAAVQLGVPRSSRRLPQQCVCISKKCSVPAAAGLPFPYGALKGKPRNCPQKTTWWMRMGKLFKREES